MELNLNDKNTAEYVVSEFFKCWLDKDFERARRYTQGTWRLGKDRGTLKELLSIYDLVGFYLYDKEVITNCRHEINFRAELLKGKKIINMYGKVNTIRETAPYMPNPKGIWGVNPISITLRWIKQK